MQKSKIHIKIDKVPRIIDFLFEAASLKRLERTGWQILGGGNKESIAEHSFMVAVISYIIASYMKADMRKVLVTALFHDFTESRTGDVSKLSDLYVKTNEEKAIADSLGCIPEISDYINDYGKDNLENRIVHDSDVLALCLELKVLIENGNSNAREWILSNSKRLKLDYSKELYDSMMINSSQSWWKKQRALLHKSMG